MAPAEDPLDDDPFNDEYDDPIDFNSGNIDFDKRMNAAFRLSNEQVFGACGEQRLLLDMLGTSQEVID